MVTRTEEKHMTPTAEALADRRKELDDARWSMERSTRGLGRRRRPTLSRYDRERILTKSGRRCHICGGEIEGNDWQADHVLGLPPPGQPGGTSRIICQRIGRATSIGAIALPKKSNGY